MATFDYPNFRDEVAARLLEKFGGDVTVTYSVSESFDTDTLANTITTQQDIAKGVLVELDDSARDNSLVEENDRKLILDASELMNEPQLGDQVLVNGETYAIKQSMTVNPAGTAVVYIFRVGK